MKSCKKKGVESCCKSNYRNKNRYKNKRNYKSKKLDNNSMHRSNKRSVTDKSNCYKSAKNKNSS